MMTKAVVPGIIAGFGGISIGNLVAGMFILVTINTQQFPITSVWWVIVMIVIFMVHCELAQPLATERSPATPTNFGEKLQSTFAITFLSFLPYTKCLRNTPLDITTLVRGHVKPPAT